MSRKTNPRSVPATQADVEAGKSQMERALPSHGRLIDADAFVKFINKEWDGYDQWFAGMLEARPTIIPASKEGENGSK